MVPVVFNFLASNSPRFHWSEHSMVSLVFISLQLCSMVSLVHVTSHAYLSVLITVSLVLIFRVFIGCSYSIVSLVHAFSISCLFISLQISWFHCSLSVQITEVLYRSKARRICQHGSGYACIT